MFMVSKKLIIVSNKDAIQLIKSEKHLQYNVSKDFRFKSKFSQKY